MNKNVWVLTASILASSMAFIDGSALNVAIPSLQKAFQATGGDVLWVLNGYFLMLAAFILPAGALGDKLGRKKVFMTGIALFMLASLLCGCAWNISSLIMARLIQGLGGALMIPGSLALINATVSEQEKGKAIGTWSAVTTLVTICGPILGGILADLNFWRGVFLLNLPLGLTALFILATKVPESRNELDSGPIDWLGALLLALGLGSLSYGILEVPDFGFHNLNTSGAIVAGMTLLISFILHQARSTSPMMPLHLFQSPSFLGANVLTLFLYGALSAGLFFLSLNMIQVQGYSQTLAGLATIPFALLLSLLSRRIGGLSDRFGPRYFLTGGPALVAIGFLLLSLPTQTHGPADYWLSFFPGIVVFGLGMAITVAPLTTTVLASAGRHYSGTASGINNAVSRIAAVLAIAVIGAVALSSFQHSLAKRTAVLHLTQETQSSLNKGARKLAATSPPQSLDPAQRQQIQVFIRESFIQTYQLIMLICAVLAGVSALLAWLLIQNNKSPVATQGNAIMAE
jgi:EmrB/QacA subfamily drug resistance transporter